MYSLAKGGVKYRENKCTFVYLKYFLRTFSVKSREMFFLDLQNPVMHYLNPGSSHVGFAYAIHFLIFVLSLVP